MFPLITALVAGDIVAAEDHNGTLKTILTRSVDRHVVFGGQGARGHDLRGGRDRPQRRGGGRRRQRRVRASTRSSTLTGTTVSASHALGLVGGSLLVYLMPILAIAAIGLLFSTVFRNSAAAVVGTLMVSLLAPADRDPARARLRCARTCSAPSSTPGRASCASPSTGPRSCERRGCARSTGCPRWSPPSWSSCAATSPAAERATALGLRPPSRGLLRRPYERTPCSACARRRTGRRSGSGRPRRRFGTLPAHACGKPWRGARSRPSR